jgi:hypothetical protein
MSVFPEEPDRNKALGIWGGIGGIGGRSRGRVRPAES